MKIQYVKNQCRSNFTKKSDMSEIHLAVINAFSGANDYRKVYERNAEPERKKNCFFF